MQGRKKQIDMIVTDEGGRGDPIGVFYADGTYEHRALARARARRKRRSPVSFVMIEEAAALMAPRSITPTQSRILYYLLGLYQEQDQMSVASQAQMMHDLKVEKSNLRRAIADLIERKFLYRLGPKAWMVSPHVGFRGNTKLWRSLMDRYDEPLWDGLPAVVDPETGELK